MIEILDREVLAVVYLQCIESGADIEFCNFKKFANVPKNCLKWNFQNEKTSLPEIEKLCKLIAQFERIKNDFLRALRLVWNN